MSNLISLLFGVLFAVGLSISGMVNPDKVIGFLDIFGNWDYSLAFVMGGAVGVNLVLFPLILKKKPILSELFHLPTKSDLESNLIVGSAIFGVGWGVAGVCPGPGIVNLGRFDYESIAFVASMLGGMFIYSIYKRKLS